MDRVKRRFVRERARPMFGVRNFTCDYSVLSAPAVIRGRRRIFGCRPFVARATSSTPQRWIMKVVASLILAAVAAHLRASY